MSEMMRLGERNNSLEDRPSNYADRVGAEVVAAKTIAERKAGGLYLTPVEVADFMASLVTAHGDSIRILDPAAGSGTLLCAVVERLASFNKPFREAELTAYETDPDLQDSLSGVLGNLKRWAAKRHITVQTRIERQDFLLAHAEILTATHQLFRRQSAPLFDLIMANPPYFKLPKSDRRAKAATSVVHGQPNIYALFMAVGAAVLCQGGEFLFVIPRSFASGPYFRLFRNKFFANIRPTDIHLFDSRRKAFGRDEVLQENIILKGVRDDDWQGRKARFTLSISNSAGIVDLEHLSRRSLPLEDALDTNSAEKVLRLPILREEDEAVRLVDSWPGSLHLYGMNISTGPVVPFRATEFLDETGVPADSYVPLIWMNHVHAMRISFPNGTRKPQYIKRSASERSLLLPNRNYVLLRRFSAKEEARRLVAAPWLKRNLACPLVGIENHLNYIYRPAGELDEEEAYGLAALLNSTLLDTYFRVSSGNTQVSASELRAMPLPPRDVILSIGRRAKTMTVSKALDDAVREAVDGR
jgi:adenine-specific DNA-methyltransferase